LWGIVRDFRVQLAQIWHSEKSLMCLMQRSPIGRLYLRLTVVVDFAASGTLEHMIFLPPMISCHREERAAMAALELMF